MVECLLPTVCDCNPKQPSRVGHHAVAALLDHTLRPPAGKIYAIPWRSSSILEFDPETKVLRLFGSVTATNYTW